MVGQFIGADRARQTLWSLRCARRFRRDGRSFRRHAGGDHWRSACSIRSCFRRLCAAVGAWASGRRRRRAYFSGVVGGAVVPLLTGAVADQVGLGLALLVPAACYIWVAFYGIFTARNKILDDVPPGLEVPVLSG